MGKLRKLILNENISSAKLASDMTKEAFAKLVVRRCGKLMSVKLCDKIYDDLLQQKGANCETIYNKSNKFIEAWWAAKKTKLKQKCIELGIDKQYF